MKLLIKIEGIVMNRYTIAIKSLMMIKQKRLEIDCQNLATWLINKTQ